MKEGNAGHTFNLVGFGSREEEEEKYKNVKTIKKEKKKVSYSWGHSSFQSTLKGSFQISGLLQILH